jgi:hypothetical protein
MQPHVTPETLGSLDYLMAAIDLNGDGQVSYHEWLVFLMNCRLSAKDERLHHAFRRLDKDGDGKITMTELGQVLTSESEAGISEYMKEADIDHSGAIDYEEFLQMWYRQTKEVTPIALSPVVAQNLTSPSFIRRISGGAPALPNSLSSSSSTSSSTIVTAGSPPNPSASASANGIGAARSPDFPAAY